MRSFVTTLLALSLPLSAFAGHRDHRARRHSDVAVRARGDILRKRDGGNRFTFYDITVGTTACGGTYSKDAFVVALDQAQFGTAYPSPFCNKQITITVNGKSADATIVDSCPGCPPNGLDMTEGLFKHFSALGVGVIYGGWQAGGGAPASASAPAPTTSNSPPPPTSTHTEAPPSPTPSSTYSQPPPALSSSTSAPIPAQSTRAPMTASTTSTHSILSALSSSTSTSSSLSVSKISPTQSSGSAYNGYDNLGALNLAIVDLADVVEGCSDP